MLRLWISVAALAMLAGITLIFEGCGFNYPALAARRGDGSASEAAARG